MYNSHAKRATKNLYQKSRQKDRKKSRKNKKKQKPRKKKDNTVDKVDNNTIIKKKRKSK